MLEFSPAFTNASFQKIAFDCSLEQFLGNRDEYTTPVLTIVGKISVS